MFGGSVILNLHVKESGEDGRLLKDLRNLIREYHLEESVYFAASPDVLEKMCRYTPDIRRCAIQLPRDTMPIMEVPQKYVVFKPLPDVEPGMEQPEVVVFLADPDQLSALVVLANYAREGNENVIIPFAAGCQQIGIFAYREARSDTPRAVIGLTDLSARKNLKKQIDRNMFSFAVPWRMFREMEDNVEGSFLEKETWRSLAREP